MFKRLLAFQLLLLIFTFCTLMPVFCILENDCIIEKVLICSIQSAIYLP